MLKAALLSSTFSMAGVQCWTLFPTQGDTPMSWNMAEDWFCSPLGTCHVPNNVITALKICAVALAFASLQQGLLAVTLHLVGIIVNTAQDEQYWRQLGHPKGLRLDTNTVLQFITSPLSVFTLSKPILHWMLSLTSNADIYSTLIFEWYPVQILNFTLFLAMVAAILTMLALWRPRGFQPATYGHIQSIADLVDEWPAEGQKRMYWGHKGLHEPRHPERRFSDWHAGEKWCHAGTSPIPLKPVNGNALYA
ncbi:hypothetical protein CONPUDRAFT_76160 [Coniophora puteana RWD-64-598 SS2]|uniref:Uncharacterized protein n=1 Tax=Coniophora puteana (strain RWD-64-598) TaxID=741705 RepID=A0A5M3ME71_CONPW|nr:uncharacterized protein CONPUDRAFT_76160 [Coniophora puteana RWD-64-598 SS2]EIW77443.1 hypothetical protein CONPUDRAFT_76160 [Coniophora puteana RWD-64-598 SS2]